MSAREEILANIRTSLISSFTATTTARENRIIAAAGRVDSHPRGVIPARTSNPRSSSLALFCKKVIASQASLKKVKSYARAGPAIQAFLRQHNLPQILKTGTDRRLKKLVWEGKTSPEILVGPSSGDDLVAVSHALGAISETGTLLLTSGPENPTTLNFLPENHVIIVRKRDIRKSYESLWKALRRKFGKGNLPRAVNLITGPSRSADIEQTLILGAHGPLKLHIIIVDD